MALAEAARDLCEFGALQDCFNEGFLQGSGCRSSQQWGVRALEGSVWDLGIRLWGLRLRVEAYRGV